MNSFSHVFQNQFSQEESAPDESYRIFNETLPRQVLDVCIVGLVSANMPTEAENFLTANESQYGQVKPPNISINRGYSTGQDGAASFTNLYSR